MTKKQYRSAMGKTVDMGSLLLQNEEVRAVGNMGVNARGDVVSSNNKIIEKKSRQVQRHNRRSTNVSNNLVTTSTSTLRQQQTADLSPVISEDTFDDLPEDNNVVADPVVSAESTNNVPLGGLASAIARSRIVQQELEKNPRQLAKQTPGVRKL
jgi:hypothetical protein